MPDYRRAQVQLLRTCFQTTMKAHPFSIHGIVILPDHLHAIWTLPENDSDFSTRWRLIKGKFSQHCSDMRKEEVSESRFQKSERGVWQRRFWEHAIRDQQDFNRHLDYIHYNPVKHGLVSSPAEWRHSSFLSFVRRGMYPENWGGGVARSLADMDLE